MAAAVSPPPAPLISARELTRYYKDYVLNAWFTQEYLYDALTQAQHAQQPQAIATAAHAILRQTDRRAGHYRPRLFPALDTWPNRLHGVVEAALLAEAVNLAAKQLSPRLYDLKGAIIWSALALGARGGWSEDEDGAALFVLFTPTTGAAAFHDPHGNVNYFLRHYRPLRWPVTPPFRSRSVNDLLFSYRYDGTYLAHIAHQTTPPELQNLT